MEITNHPSLNLHADWITLIRKAAPVAEQARQLLPEQLELIYQQQWFKILTPKQYGGLELALNHEVRLIEALSWADGSLGWVITLCTGAGWFGGFLNPDYARDVFAQRNVCLAGSGAPNGTADLTSDGYLVNGRWKYASGALNTTHFTANCKITQNGQPVLDNGDVQLILPFIFTKNEVNVIPAWGYMGMVATGSHSFEVQNVTVPKIRCFKIDPEYAVVSNPLYKYPFLQLAQATLAVNISGMAIHFIDLCYDAFANKKLTKSLTAVQEGELDNVLRWAVKEINDLRIIFYEAVDQSWEDYTTGDSNNPDNNLNVVSKASHQLATQARKIVDELYPYCGLEAARPTTDLNRVWRDVHTASQHAALTFSA